MISNPHEARCINQECYLRRDCALFVKERRVNEVLFAGRPIGGDCDHFKDLHQSWGQGHEPND